MKSKGDPSVLVKNRNDIVEEMREQFGYVFCLECDRSSGFRNLHVHHIVFRSEAPHHDNLHSKQNLLIVCDECHTKLHNQKFIREKWVVRRNLRHVFSDIIIKEEY